MAADTPALLGVVDDVVKQLTGDGERSLVLAFGCVARMAVMGADFPLEAELITDAAGGATVFGMYTYGEFARSDGVGGVHNATLTALAL